MVVDLKGASRFLLVPTGTTHASHAIQATQAQIMDLYGADR